MGIFLGLGFLLDFGVEGRISEFRIGFRKMKLG